MDLIYPKTCIHCEKLVTGKQSLCISCLFQLPYINIKAENKLHPANIRLQYRFPYQYAYSTFLRVNDGIIDSLVKKFKYHLNMKIGDELGEWMAQDVEKNFPLDEIDIIVPVPLHKKKQRKRGFNQTHNLCKSIANRYKKPLSSNNLIRKQFTESQTLKNRSERLENMKNTFSVKKPNEFIGKHILLVDDILTTGATIESCALELLKIEDCKVSIATLAIASE